MLNANVNVSRDVDNPYEELGNAIILQAGKDYIHYRKRFNKHHKDVDFFRMIECEKFFHSDWAQLLTDLDPVVIIEKIKKECEKNGY